MAWADPSPDPPRPLLAALPLTEVAVVDRLGDPWKAPSLHRHNISTLVIPLLSGSRLAVVGDEILSLPVGHLPLIGTWTWHSYRRPHGDGASLTLDRCGALAGFERRGASGPWWGEAADAPQPAPGGGPPHRLCTCAWLHRTRPVTVAQVLAASSLSYAQTHRPFVRRFGKTPKRYLPQCRLDLAQHLLAAGRTPDAVWRDCGFASRTDLIRRMRLSCGAPPRSWRRPAG